MVMSPVAIYFNSYVRLKMVSCCMMSLRHDPCYVDDIFFMSMGSMSGGCVRKYYDVKNRAFSQNVMRDFDNFYAQFSFVNYQKYITSEKRIFSMKKKVCFSYLMCEIVHRAALTLSLHVACQF